MRVADYIALGKMVKKGTAGGLQVTAKRMKQLVLM